MGFDSIIYVGFFSAISITIFFFHAKNQIESSERQHDKIVSELKKSYSTLATNLASEKTNISEFLYKESQYIKNINKELAAQKSALGEISDFYIKQVSEIKYNYESSLAQISTEKRLTNHRTNFVKDLYQNYNLFVSIIIKLAADIMYKYVLFKGYDYKVSISLKLLNSPIELSPNNSTTDINSTYVFTAFRDSETKDEWKREIGEKEYSILGNTDFTQCLRKEWYFANNLSRGDANYNNEHSDFDQYYNCTGTVPVRVGKASNGSLYGYLCCDVLNDLNSQNTIIDKHMCDLLFAAASLLGIYIQEAINFWNDHDYRQIEKGLFLEYVRNATKNPTPIYNRE